MRKSYHKRVLHKVEKIRSLNFAQQFNYFSFFFFHLTGDKPHACELCNKRFALACNLRAHMKTHDDEQQENCVRCGQNFLASSEDIKDGICRECEKEPINVDDELEEEAIQIHHKKFSNKSINVPTIAAH